MAAVVPEVDERTRVLAILGTLDPDPAGGDGWIVADFCLLNQLLRDQCIEQKWLHGLDFNAALSEYGPMIHGQPHRSRKIVYQDGMSLAHLAYCPEDDLKSTFMSELSRMARQSKPNDRILIILLGHGSEPPEFGLCIGDHPLISDYASISQYTLQTRYLITKDEVETGLSHSHSTVSRCNISNSCYAGNWMCSNNSRSAIVAVGTDEQSDSLPRSQSSNFRGSYFTAALCQALRQTHTIEDTFKDLTRNITSNLDNLWAFLLAKNPPSFSAQDEAWDDSVQERTGLAQVEYAARYNALPDHPPSPAADGSDRQRARRNRYLRMLIREYKLIGPGPETMAPNIRVTSAIYAFEENLPHRPLSPERALWLSVVLKHRLNLASVAQWVIGEARLLPFPTFRDWEVREWPYKDKVPYDTVTEIYAVIRRFQHTLFPIAPWVANPGVPPFRKPMQYIAYAAIAKGLDSLELHSRLWRIAKAVDSDLLEPSDGFEIV